MSGCVICGGELPPRRLGHNGGGRPRVMCGSVECKRAYNRAAARVAYRKLRELNEAGIYARWQKRLMAKRKPKTQTPKVRAVVRERSERMSAADYAWGTM